jgi:hypothetical protein
MFNSAIPLPSVDFKKGQRQHWSIVLRMNADQSLFITEY